MRRRQWRIGKVCVEGRKVMVPVSGPELVCGMCGVVTGWDELVLALGSGESVEVGKHFASVCGGRGVEGGEVEAVAAAQQAADMVYAVRALLHTAVRSGDVDRPTLVFLHTAVEDIADADLGRVLFGGADAPPSRGLPPAKRAKAGSKRKSSKRKSSKSSKRKSSKRKSSS